MYFVSREKSLIQAVRSVIRTFFLLLIPYFIITKLSYPIEFFPRPIYSISLLALISLLTANNSSVLDKVEVKFDTVKKFFSVRDRAIPTFGLFLFNCIECLNHRSIISGLTLSVLSLIVAFMPLDDKEKQIITIIYFFSMVFFFLSFI
jgi:hypothetical protein